MKVKNVLRRVNRGIVLGILLIVGLSGYLVVDSIAFEGEREVIRDVIEGYMEELPSMILLPESYREIGTEIPDSVIDDKMKENGAILDKYFSTNAPMHGGVDARRSAESDFLVGFRENQGNGGRISSYETDLVSVNRITKHGSSLVTVEVVYRVVATATTQAYVYDGFLSVVNYSFGGMALDEEDMSFSTYTSEITCTYRMTKQNGVWKFYGIENFSSSFAGGGYYSVG